MAQLSRMGLKRGNTVALLSDNSVEFVLGLLAIMFSGARVAPLNPALTSNELGTRLLQLPANALLVTAHLANQPGLANRLPQSLAYCIMHLEASGCSQPWQGAAGPMSRVRVGSQPICSGQMCFAWV